MPLGGAVTIEQYFADSKFRPFVYFAVVIRAVDDVNCI